MLTTLVFLLMALATTTISSIDYCSEELCDETNHIACNNKRKFLTGCPTKAVSIVFTNELKKLAVDSHNKLRNQIATGKLKRYEKAARMATLVWNDELAKFAEYNVFRCVFAHDECRNTAVFKYAGQNLGLLWNLRKFQPTENVIDTITNGWYNEHKDADMYYIQKYSVHNKGLMIGHFTQLVRDQAYAVGCAMAQYKKGRQYTTLYTCNYSLSNILDYPIYENTTNAASKCKSGTNIAYPGLCSTDEIYDYELFYN